MTATTLYTFSPYIPYTYSVQLLGSWDNFTTPYQLEKDRQRGHGHWVGCHSFKSICCDGDVAQPVEQRTGGLMQGGTYWYYYKLDGDIDHADTSSPLTLTCPMLPGQLVNILEVPIEVPATPDSDNSNELACAFTLDPQDRFRKLKEPTRRKHTGTASILGFRNDTPRSAGGRKLSRVFSGIHRLTAGAMTTRSSRSMPVRQTSFNKETSTRVATSPAPVDVSVRTPSSQHQSRLDLEDRPPSRDGDMPTENKPIAWHDNAYEKEAHTPTTSSPDGCSPNRGWSSAKSSSQQTLLANRWSGTEASIRRSHMCKNTPPSNALEATISSLDPLQPSLAQDTSFTSASLDHEGGSSPTPLETPPQLCAAFSTDTSPMSIITPRPPPPHTQHEMRRLQFLDYDTPPNSSEAFPSMLSWWRLPITEHTEASEANGEDDVEQLRLGSPVGRHAQATTQPTNKPTGFDNPFAKSEFLHLNPLKAAPNTGFLHARRPRTAEAAVPWHAGCGLGMSSGSEGQSNAREVMLHDLAYLGAVIV